MAEEVKIVIREESQGDALRQTEQRLDRVTAAGKRAAGTTSQPPKGLAVAPHYLNAPATKKPETKAAVALRNRALIADAEEELARSRAVGAAPTIIAQREKELRQRKLASRYMREQGMDDSDAMGRADDVVSAQVAAKQRDTAEKTLAKTRTESERIATREMQEQERIAKRMTMQIGSAGAVALGAFGAELGSSYFENQSIENKAAASRQLTARQLNINSGARGTSGQVQAEAWAAEDEAAALKAQTPEVENQARKKKLMGALTGAATGAVTGFFRGGVLGAVVGAGIGAASGYGIGTVEGNTDKKGHQTQIQTKEQEAQKKQELATKKALEEETGLEVDAIHQRSKRTMEGIRAAQVDDLTMSGMQKFRSLYSKGMTGKQAEKAKEAAMEYAQNELRDRQISGASGLVDARAGASDIAAAARWSHQSMPGIDALNEKLAPAIDRMIRAYDKGTEATTREPFGKL